MPLKLKQMQIEEELEVKSESSIQGSTAKQTPESGCADHNADFTSVAAKAVKGMTFKTMKASASQDSDMSTTTNCIFRIERHLKFASNGSLQNAKALDF